MNFDDLAHDLDIPEFINTHNTALRFPDKLMLMLIFIEREYAKTVRRAENAPAIWTMDGRAFVIRNQDELVKSILPRIFQKSKFSSFTRKLYRWGFRQVFTDGTSKKSDLRDMIFANENFQRDNKPLLANMRSTTAEGARREMKKPNSSQEIPSDEQHNQSATLEHFGRSSPSTVTVQEGQPSLREDILALLAASETALSRPTAPVLPTQQFQPSAFGGTAELSFLHSLPFLNNLVAQQQSISQQSAAQQQSSLVASLLMSAVARGPVIPLPNQQLLLSPVATYNNMDTNRQSIPQSALAVYMQQQQDQDAAATVRQLLANILSQTNQNPALFTGQSNPNGSDQNRDASQPR